MLSFKFSRRDAESITYGFDIGDVEISNDKETITTKNRTPDQGTMIYLLIVSLLDGLYELVEKKTKKKIEVIAPDSSFNFQLSIIKNKSISVQVGDKIMATLPINNFITCLLNEIEYFLTDNPLYESDPVYFDLINSLNQFKKFST